MPAVVSTEGVLGYEGSAYDRKGRRYYNVSGRVNGKEASKSL